MADRKESAASAPPVVMIATMTPKPGQEDKLRETLRAMVGPTRREDGCVTYNLHERPETDGVAFLFYEIWQDEAALARHMETPHVQTLISQERVLVSGSIMVERLVCLEPG